MKEIFFIVQEDQDGGYTARAVGEAIFTEADTVKELKENIKEALLCHFDSIEEMPKIANLHFVRDEILTFA
jgi:hypothetical protein